MTDEDERFPTGSRAITRRTPGQPVSRSFQAFPPNRDHYPAVCYLSREDDWAAALSPDAFDTAALTAFCVGDMPPPVFADWLEENVPDVPLGALELLRSTNAE